MHVAQPSEEFPQTPSDSLLHVQSEAVNGEGSPPASAAPPTGTEAPPTATEAPPPTPQKALDAIWFNRDGYGMACSALSWFLIFYAEAVTFFILLPPVGTTPYAVLNGALSAALALLTLASHATVMCTDPGVVPKGGAPPRELPEGGGMAPPVPPPVPPPGRTTLYRCPKCCSFRPDRAHHCSVCRRCVRKMDHHCPWVNNCIGENNQKPFVLLTLYLALLCGHTLLLLFIHAVSCTSRTEDWSGCGRGGVLPWPTVAVGLLLLLFFESLLFLSFAAVIFSSQVHAICADTTYVEQLKRERRVVRRSSGWANAKDVFGHPCSVAWLCPFTPPRRRPRRVDTDRCVV